jgi:hypothetical protein
MGKAPNAPGKQLVETADQPADDADRVPEQGAVGRVVDVGFHHGGVGSEFLAVLQPESNRSPYHLLIEGFQGGGGEFAEGPVEGIVFGDRAAEELGDFRKV